MHLDRLVRAAPDFVALHEPTLFIYSFRYVPEGEERPWVGAAVETERRNTLEARIADEIQLSVLAFRMTTRIRGRVALRLSICSHRTTIGDIDLVFERLREIGERVAREDRASV